MEIVYNELIHMFWWIFNGFYHILVVVEGCVFTVVDNTVYLSVSWNLTKNVWYKDCVSESISFLNVTHLGAVCSML